MYCTVFVHQMACEKLLDVVSGIVPPNQEPTKTPEDQGRVKNKTRKGKITSHLWKNNVKSLILTFEYL